MKLDAEQTDQFLKTCIHFMQEIGISVEFRSVPDNSFLPGLFIENGGLVIDREKLKYPGDILHEAGHIAVMHPSVRPTMNNQTILDSKTRDSDEMMAIAWSYAAVVHLGLDPHIVFHDEGYKGGGSNIVENFSTGHYFGTPMLQWCGMTLEPRRGQLDDSAVYPKMLHWVRMQ